MTMSSGLRLLPANSIHTFLTRSSSTLRPILISIEGNIGAGKSTYMEALKKSYPQWNFIDEPVGIWSKIKNNEGKSLLEVFYSDRKRWSYTFQSCALLSRFQNIEDSIREKTLHRMEERAMDGKMNIFITERCLDTDFYVFTTMLREENSIDSLEYDLYCRLYQHLRSKSTPLGGIIYVSTDPEECSKRIAGRNRSGESGISLDYLKNLDRCQREWIKSFDGPIIESPTQSMLLLDIDRFVEKTLLLAGIHKST